MPNRLSHRSIRGTHATMTITDFDEDTMKYQILLLKWEKEIIRAEGDTITKAIETAKDKIMKTALNGGLD